MDRQVEISGTKAVISDTLKGSTRRQWLIALLVNVTVLGSGMQAGWIACSAKILQSDESPAGVPLSVYDISWLASYPSLSGMISIPLFMFAVDRLGRKPCIAFSGVLFIACWIIKLSCSSMTGLVIARLLAGTAGGGCLFTVPIYVKEISQDDVRGTLGMIMTVSRISGILIMYIMGTYMEYYTVLWTVIGMTAINLVAVLLAPESPTFYVKIGNMNAAASTIAYLRGLTVEDKVVKNAIDSIVAEDERFKSIPDVNFIGIFKQKAWRKGFIFMVLLMLTHGLNGGFSIVNYAPAFIAELGITFSPDLVSLSIPIFMVIGSLVSMVLIERLGRKWILTVLFLLSMISFGALATIIMIQSNGGFVPGWITIAVLIVPVYTYAAAVAPLPYVIMAEMFNFQIRAKMTGCLTMLSRLCGFVQTLVIIPNAIYGTHITFICAAVMNLLGSVVVLVLVPETKAKSIEQIELELEKKLEKKN